MGGELVVSNKRKSVLTPRVEEKVTNFTGTIAIPSVTLIRYRHPYHLIMPVLYTLRKY